ncbi:MAG: patatin [Actinobacteria bacterium]|nr:MAG: patatin [Actinomycetota bacterium]
MRIGLVLGGGGLTGGAFHAGVISALADAGWDARTASILQGTSAGSITATSLAAGFPPADLVRRHLGRPLSAQANAILARVGPDSREWEAAQERSLRPASPGLLADLVRNPWGAHPGKIAAAALPEGRVSTAGIARGMAELCGGVWPADSLRISALRLSDGQTVIFGGEGAPRPEVGAAVAASCAIPGYFAPVEIGGERYVDGGTTSACNAGAVLHEELDVVLVSAPMAIHSGVRVAPDTPWRRVVRHQVDREIRVLRTAGVQVVLFAPTAEVAAAMGANPMAPGREAESAEAAYADTAARIAEQPELRRLFG